VRTGLFKSRLGLDLPITSGLLAGEEGSASASRSSRRGEMGDSDDGDDGVRLECVGEVEESALRSWSDSTNSQLIKTVRLPEALRRELKEVYVGKTAKCNSRRPESFSSSVPMINGCESFSALTSSLISASVVGLLLIR